LPPATSPRESELPSPASLWLAFPVVTVAPALALVLSWTVAFKSPPLFDVLPDEVACALPAELPWLSVVALALLSPLE